MKTLVYENYNKFISATDTIRQMKRNVENMEEEINRLSQTMKAISSGTESVNSSLHDNREQIEKLSGVSTLLKKRQFLFELPSRLNKCIASSSHAEAIRYYNGTRYVHRESSHRRQILIMRHCSRVGDAQRDTRQVQASAVVLGNLHRDRAHHGQDEASAAGEPHC